MKKEKKERDKLNRVGLWNHIRYGLDQNGSKCTSCCDEHGVIDDHNLNMPKDIARGGNSLKFFFSFPYI